MHYSRSLESEHLASQPPSYPSSHPKKKDWDAILKDEEIKLESEGGSGEDPTLNFFKEIYSRGSEEQRRAMMKSFATSNGMALSTNWDEMKNKDYEGKDRLDPPKGQELRKYEI